MDVPTTDVPAASELAMTQALRRRAIVAATLGNGLEFFDFITFAFFAVQIGNTFFPSHSSFLSLMGALATFFAGFLTRPLGALVLGTYADRVGRKPAMMVSMSLMGFGIVMLVATPGYATIGYAAPMIAVIARMIQGFALGGEVGSATIYMMESADPNRRAFAMSWQGASQGIAASIGAAVGLFLTLILTDIQLSVFGWRIALALGVSIVPVALYVRSSLPETIDQPECMPVGHVGVRSYLRPIVCGLTIIGSGTIATYIFQYMATFGQHTLHLSSSLSMAGEFANNAIGVVAVLIGGIVSDRRGRRHVMLVSQALLCALVVPCFLWLTNERDGISFIGANLILSFASTYMYGAVYAAISESLPKAVRARVFALVYALPVALLGGSTQLVITWILHVTGSPMAIAWYLTGVSLIGLAAMLAIRESAPVKLRPDTLAELPYAAQPA
jgi:MFS transporter, MHS family, citrate/tricarballylate:H+ symporter